MLPQSKIESLRRSLPRLRWLGAAGLGFLLAAALASAASFTATLDRDTVEVGDSAVLTLKFEGGEPRPAPTLPGIANVQIANGGRSESVSIINGQVSSSISQTYGLTPIQPGEFVIPALRVEIGGQALVSQPLKLKAVKAATTATDAAGTQLAFFKLAIPKKQAFVGEVIGVELQVFMREGIANGENILQGFDAYGGVPLKAEGFSVLKTAHAQRRRARIGNANYEVATLVTSLSPVKAGPLTIGSIDVPLTLQLPAANQRRRDGIWDPFGMFQRFDEKRLTLTAEPEPITVLPLPKENVPANFNGAVGSFTLAVTAGPTNIGVGDPITVKVQIAGRGAFDSLTLPGQTAWGDFKTYPPTSKIETTDALGLQGTKTFEQIAVPQSADLKQLPPFAFSFFDPDQKVYRTLAQPGLPLVVHPNTSVSPPPTVVAANRPGENNPPPAQDIVPNKQRLGVIAQIAPPLVQQPWFLALQSVPILTWISALIWRKRRDSLANNPRLRRQRQVAHLVRDGLGELRQFAAAQKAEEFFAVLVRLLQEQLGERLDLPASAITEAVIEEHLRPRGVSADILTPLQELFQTCNLVRYAPIKTSQELNALIPKVETVLGSLQHLKL